MLVNLQPTVSTKVLRGDWGDDPMKERPSFGDIYLCDATKDKFATTHGISEYVKLGVRQYRSYLTARLLWVSIAHMLVHNPRPRGLREARFKVLLGFFPCWQGKGAIVFIR